MYTYPASSKPSGPTMLAMFDKKVRLASCPFLDPAQIGGSDTTNAQAIDNPGSSMGDIWG